MLAQSNLGECEPVPRVNLGEELELLSHTASVQQQE